MPDATYRDCQPLTSTPWQAFLLAQPQDVEIAKDQQATVLAAQHYIKATFVKRKARANLSGSSENDHYDLSLAPLERVNCGGSGHV